MYSVTLKNPFGMSVTVHPYGCTITSIKVPFSSEPEEVLLGCPTTEEHSGLCFGSMVGRYANRIAGAQFDIGGRSFQLDKNSNDNCLHGGSRGFSTQDWSYDGMSRSDREEEVFFSLLSPSGDQGFPGRLSVRCRLALSARCNTLRLEYTATTDAPTHVSMTHHPYFNLTGAPNVRDHILCVNAGCFLPINQDLLPTGEIRELAHEWGLDLRTPTRVGDLLDQEIRQIQLAGGIDHCYILDMISPPAAFLRAGNRVLRLYTSEPGLQVFTGNCTEGATGRNGERLEKHAGICLETQHFPDTPHHKHFPNTLLLPGQTYHSWTVFQFDGTHV